MKNVIVGFNASTSVAVDMYCDMNNSTGGGANNVW